VGRSAGRHAVWVAAVAALIASTSAFAQAAAPEPAKPDAMTQAYLFGAAFKKSDLSQAKPGGMMFLPGRGLIRWDTQGKSLAEQEELKTEAIGLADARAVQAEIDAQRAAQAHVGDAERLSKGQTFAADSLAPSRAPVDLAPVTGTRRQAGGVVALNQAARAASAGGVLGVRNGARYGERNRVYMFGAVSGRAVGLNLLHDSGAGWRGGGLSSDEGGFTGQRQAGLAVRRGSAQAAISYVQEKTHTEIVGLTSVKDHRAMLSLSYIPKLPKR